VGLEGEVEGAASPRGEEWVGQAKQGAAAGHRRKGKKGNQQNSESSSTGAFPAALVAELGEADLGKGWVWLQRSAILSHSSLRASAGTSLPGGKKHRAKGLTCCCLRCGFGFVKGEYSLPGLPSPGAPAPLFPPLGPSSRLSEADVFDILAQYYLLGPEQPTVTATAPLAASASSTGTTTGRKGAPAGGMEVGQEEEEEKEEEEEEEEVKARRIAAEELQKRRNSIFLRLCIHNATVAAG